MPGLLTGGCLCGAVRYEAAGTPFHRTHCHCSVCRRSTGAPFVAWFSVPKAAWRIVQGAPLRFRSSPHATRSFCGQCGTQLTFEDDTAGEEIDITTCSLDDPERLPPEDHTHAGSKLSWIALADGLPVHRAGRAGP
jgi:hypothetical protein